MAVIHTKAIILRHSTDREHDRLLTVLTPQHGQLRVRARGTKKSTSKLAGSLEPMTEVDLSLADGRVVEQVIGSVIIDRFPVLHDDLVASVSSQWLLELVDVMTKPAQPTAGLYDLVRQSLVEMSSEVVMPLGRRWLLLLRRASLFLAHEGFRPSLDVCGRCHRPLEGLAAYEPAYGFVHRGEAAVDALMLDDHHLLFLRTGQWPQSERPALLHLHKIIEAMIHHTIDQPLRSERVLRSVMRVELPVHRSSE